MSKKHVMLFTPDGSVEFTRSPDLDGFFNGTGRMERVTDIQKSPYAPYYMIKWLMGPHEGFLHTRTTARTYLRPEEIVERFCPEHIRADEPMRFDTYEAAVAHEILVLNAMRKKGIVFNEWENGWKKQPHSPASKGAIRGADTD